MGQTLNDVRELLNLAAPLAFERSKVDGSTEFFTKVKGFASVALPDRSKELVDPAEFNIASFLSRPVLLLNHRFWIDNTGNQVAIGVIKEMFVATVVSGEDADYYYIKRAGIKEPVDKFPKAKAPDLSIGVRGLWVIAEVSVPEVAKQVERGELNAFSWRGLARVKYTVNASGETQKNLTNIDLFEVSIVHMPDNGAATFTVAKTTGHGTENTQIDTPLVVQSVRLDKNRFDTEVMAKEYLNKHNLEVGCICDDGTAFFAKQLDLSEFERMSLATVKLAEGVQAIVGKCTGLPAPAANWVGVHDESMMDKLFTLFSSTQETPKMAQDIKKEETSSNETVAQDTKTDAQKQFDIMAKTIGETTANAVMTAQKPMFDALTTALKGLGEAVQSLAQKSAPAAEAKTEAKAAETNETEKTQTEATKSDGTKKEDVDIAKRFDAMTDVLKGVAESLNTALQTAKEAKAKAEDVAKSVPTQVEREEQIVAKGTAATNEKPDPNACFNQLWPTFTAKR